MKTKILIILSVLAGMIACESNEKFLEEHPYGRLFPHTFYSSEAELELAINALFIQQMRAFNRDYESLSPALGAADDVTMAVSSWDVFQPVSGTDDTDLELGWERCFLDINYANGIIDNYRNAEGTMPEEKLNQYPAMAHFVRAFNYFWLVRFFNNMPKITTTTLPDFNVTVSPKEEIYALIVEDLQFAEQWLPVEWTGKKRTGGAPTQGAAKAMLAKVYLQMAGFPVNGGAEYYAKARDKAKEVMDNAATYHYILREHCIDLWDPYWILQAEDEVIYFCKGLPASENYTVRSPLACRPRENLGEGSGWEMYLAENYFYEHFPEGERKKATFVDTIYFKPREDGTQEVRHYTEMAAKHPFYKKEWADDRVSDWSWDRMWERADWNNGRSFIALRYAEVLLIYAEAQARADGSPNALAYDCLNRIRNRAKAGVGSTGAEVAGLSTEAFLDSVVWERAWEFAGSESYTSRWFDLQRLELVEKAATEWRREPDAPIAQTPTKKHYFLQIPSAEVVKNPALNNNNPEY
ncbi:MAG: RagB/SusD family nutrient uptake outer membrane protein [Tannerella sp.]|jgi:hypothetical protein|nr:RagB/SusD family nutrient uptake outer membrane protein [Tannerella sp.]